MSEGGRSDTRPMTKNRLQEMMVDVRAMEAMLEVLAIANEMVKRQESANIPTAFATLMMEWAKAEPQMRAIARAIAEEARGDVTTG